MTTLVDILFKIHISQEFLREAIQTTLVKILKNTTKSVKVFDYIVKKLLVGDLSENAKVDEGFLFKTSSSISLFLIIRKIYREKFQGESKEYNTLMNSDFIKNKTYLNSFLNIVKTQTYLYPRLHLSVQLWVEEIFVQKKNIFENFKPFYSYILENGIFNFKVYDEMKSIAKFKYLHIGLSIV